MLSTHTINPIESWIAVLGESIFKIDKYYCIVYEETFFRIWNNLKSKKNIYIYIYVYSMILHLISLNNVMF